MFPAAKELRERAANALGLGSAGEQGASQRDQRATTQSRTNDAWSQGAPSQAAAEAKQQQGHALDEAQEGHGTPKGLLDRAREALHLDASRGPSPMEQKGVLAIARDTLLGVAVTPGEDLAGGQETLDERSDMKKAIDAEEERGGPSFAGMPFVPPGETKAPTESDLARKEAKRVGEARAGAWGSHVDTTRPEATVTAIMKDADATADGEGSRQADLHSGKRSPSGLPRDKQSGIHNNAFGEGGSDFSVESVGGVDSTENKTPPQEAMHGREGALKVGTKKSFGEVGAPTKQGQRTFGVDNPQEDKSGTGAAKEGDSGTQNGSEKPLGGMKESRKLAEESGVGRKEQGQEIPWSEAMQQGESDKLDDKASPQEVTGGKFGSLRVGTRKSFQEAGIENKEGQVTFGTPEAQFRKLLSETGGEDQKSVAEKMSDALDMVKTTVRGKGANPTESGGVF